MKTRTGFVSNSSSSSFVVLFPKVPKTVEDVKKMVFSKDESFYPRPSGSDLKTWRINKEYWEVEEVAKTIFSDIQEQEVNNKEAMLNEVDGGVNPDDFRSGVATTYERGDGTSYTINEIDWKAYYKAEHKQSKRILEAFLKNNTETAGYVFEYSDNDSGYSSALEHDGLFENLPHIKTSKH